MLKLNFVGTVVIQVSILNAFHGIQRGPCFLGDENNIAVNM